MCSPWRPCTPQKTGSFAPSATSLEIGSAALALFWSGPPVPSRYVPPQIAIQLSMIVVITSWAPTVALRKPAIPAHTAPASVAAPTASRMCGTAFIPANAAPTQLAT